MAHDGRPIYIDRLHGERKWIPNLTDKVERERQNAAINRENGAAYMSATRIYRADGDFGAGQNTTAEYGVGYGRLAVRGDPSEDEEEASQQITGPRLVRRDIPREWLPPDNGLKSRQSADALLIAHGYPKDEIPNIPTEAYEDIVRISDDDDRGPGVWELRDSFTGTGTPRGFFYENISRQDLVKHHYPSRRPGLGLSSPPKRTFQVSDEEVYLQYGDWSEDARFKINVYSIEITRPQKDDNDESGI
ncbi:hypothetical protein CPAR01_08008 [Colletotrichum paranaense]|uniref:Uncharacterized protein n=1 Tax=Colletotrichum paranaense TaxID=1914294 RepID=A0ABQ9SJ15_9PEZI|nr:uncharacterized protein CPAR01_08008 [Colletotrichum paranaense]KAK1537895.1 hypothetical protein CPAR01_08008 [Colletotrichum paranaense]